MSITELSVKRPTAIVIAVALMIGLGIFGYINMGADLMPKVDIPIITVTTVYPGAGAEEVKKDIIKPVEDAVSGISGVDTLNSTANEGVGSTTIQFTMETDMNSALLDVQKAVDSITAKLPDDAQKPILYKLDMNQIAALTLSITGDKPHEELYNEADRIKEALEKVNGVGQVTISGAVDKELAIKLDKTAVEYYGIDVNTIIAKLKAENISMPTGTVEQEKSEKTIKVDGEFKNINQIKDLMIPISGGGTIRLGEISEIKLQYPKEDQLIKMNGAATMGISIRKQSDANVVKVVENVKKELADLEKTMTEGVKLVTVSDYTTYIKSSLRSVEENLIEGIITTVIVLFMFLRSWRSALTVLVAIPTALISTFFGMYISHFTLNMMSLMGLSLCIGILVDDSIVVLENIERHLKMGKSPIKAALEGRKEIAMAAIAITLCDIVVYTPVAFTSGMAGQYLRQFGLTVAFAAFFSLAVSFTVTPLLASRLLKRHPKAEEGAHEEKKGFMTGFMDRAMAIYKRFLIWTLNHRFRLLALVTVAFILSVALIPLGFVKMEMSPSSDESAVTIGIELSPGATLAQTDEKVRYVEGYLKGLKEVSYTYSTVGYDNSKSKASILVKMVDIKERKISQTAFAKELRKWGADMVGIDFTVMEGESRPGQASSKPVVVQVKGPNSEVITQLANQVEDLMRTVPGMVDLSNSAKISQSEMRLRIDKLAASAFGVSTMEVANVVRTGIQGSDVGVYRENGNEYDMVLKFADGQIRTTTDIGAIKLTNSKGESVHVNQVASVEMADSPQSIARLDRQDIIYVGANLQGRDLGSVTQDITKKIKTISIPKGYEVGFGGDQEQMQEVFGSLLAAMGAAIVLIYMVLVVLYESYLTPFIRMLALPCAMIGALVLLAVTGKSMNIMTMIGFIMLDGLASKSGTLLIDYTNTLMKKGIPLREALVEAGVTRLRAILMTSVTMIVGMLPAALSAGEGSEFKSGMALVVIGGMVASTILTPIIIPVVYTLIDDFKNKFFRKRKRQDAETMEVLQYVEG